MEGVLAVPLAVLPELQPLGFQFLVPRGYIIPALALCTLQMYCLSHLPTRSEGRGALEQD